MSKAWWFSDSNGEVGPLSYDELVKTLSTYPAQLDEVLIWRAGFDTWKGIRDLPEIAQHACEQFDAPPAPKHGNFSVFVQGYGEIVEITKDRIRITRRWWAFPKKTTEIKLADLHAVDFRDARTWRSGYIAFNSTSRRLWSRWASNFVVFLSPQQREFAELRDALLALVSGEVDEFLIRLGDLRGSLVGDQERNGLHANSKQFYLGAATALFLAFVVFTIFTQPGSQYGGFSDQECLADHRCWIERHHSDASLACKAPIEKRAKYGFKWDAYGWELFNAGSVDQSTGLINYRGDGVRFQNWLGVWTKTDYVCNYDPKAKMARSVEVWDK